MSKSFKTIIYSIAVVIIFSLIISPDNKPKELSAEETIGTKEYFLKNKTIVIEQLENQLTKNKLEDAWRTIKLYEHTKDKDILLKIEPLKKQRESYMLKKLKKIPAKKYEENFRLYSELYEMFPENMKYKKKKNSYEMKWNLEKEFYGKKPIQSSWDGSYYSVKNYLKSTMHNPDSLDFKGCTEVFKQDTGWLVGYQFRGDNAFGTKVLNAKWFTIKQERVVKVEPSNTYNW